MPEDFQTPQSAIDGIFRSFAEETARHNYFALNHYSQDASLDVAREFSVSQEVLNHVIRDALPRARSRLFGVDALQYAVQLCHHGASHEVIGEVLDCAAQQGFRRDVDKLAQLLGRDPTETEAYAAVHRNASDLATRSYGKRRYKHRFMTDDEVDLLEWGKQYITDPDKITELEELFRAKDRKWALVLD